MWCEFHKSSTHNTSECWAKQWLVVEMRASELDAWFESKLELDKKGWQKEAYYWCGAQRHCCHYKDPKGGIGRSRGGGTSLPLPYVGKGLPCIVHCRQWEPKEPHFSKHREAVGLSDHSSPTSIHHRVASPRTRSPRQPPVPPSLQHQGLHEWGIMWHFSYWCLWCIIRPTILVEATCCVWVLTSHCYYYFRK